MPSPCRQYKSEYRRTGWFRFLSFLQTRYAVMPKIQKEKKEFLFFFVYFRSLCFHIHFSFWLYLRCEPKCRGVGMGARECVRACDVPSVENQSHGAFVFHSFFLLCPSFAFFGCVAFVYYCSSYPRNAFDLPFCWIHFRFMPKFNEVKRKIIGLRLGYLRNRSPVGSFGFYHIYVRYDVDIFAIP